MTDAQIRDALVVAREILTEFRFVLDQARYLDKEADPRMKWVEVQVCRAEYEDAWPALIKRAEEAGL